MNLLPLLLTACALFDTSGTEARILALTDEDGDGYSLAEDDCEDLDAEVYPDAAEVCDGKDNDCDCAIDEDGGSQLWCLDEDGDGHGDPATLSTACSTPTTAVLTCDLCDDLRHGVSPEATETCNGLDDDCDGVTDPATSADVVTWYQDEDGDGYGDANRTLSACVLPEGYSEIAEDCDDGEAAVNPGQTEACNDGLDNDCDGTPNGCGLTGENRVQPGEEEEGYYSPPVGEPALDFANAAFLLALRDDGLAQPVVRSDRMSGPKS